MYCTLVNKDDDEEYEFDDIDVARRALVSFVDSGIAVYLVFHKEYQDNS